MRNFKCEHVYFLRKIFVICFSQHLLTKSNTLLKTPKSRKMAQIEIVRDSKHRFRLQKGVKNHKFFFWNLKMHDFSFQTHVQPSSYDDYIQRTILLKKIDLDSSRCPPKKKLSYVA